MSSLHSLYARRAHGEFPRTHGYPSLSDCPWPPRPGGQFQYSAKPSWSPIPLSLPFLWRNKPALRQKVQGKHDSVLGARHCCQTRLGTAHELTAANAIYRCNSFKTGTVCGKSLIRSSCFIASLGSFFSSQLSSHTGHCCRHNCAKQQQCKRCKDNESAGLPRSLTENTMTWWSNRDFLRTEISAAFFAFDFFLLISKTTCPTLEIGILAPSPR